jgi:enoyl-CoA hydratase/carnithine racemase
MFEDVKIEVADGVGTLTMDRGDGRNALRPDSLREICEAIDRLTNDADVRVIVLAGAGKHFSAGADFAFLQKLTTMPAVEIRDQIYSAFQGAARRIWNCPKPTLAAINGAAITVGCELALACDFRIVAPDAIFQESWIKLGILPPLGGMLLLPHLIGLGRANEMILTGRAVAADEAVAIGLASRKVDSVDALMPAALSYAAELATLPSLAFRAAKEGVHRGLESSMAKEWETNLLAQSMLLGTEDFREGLAAVTARRTAEFVGR